MLIGTADLDELSRRAPEVPGFSTAPLALERVDVLQVMYEMPGGCREALLPPALHPTDPPVVSWLVYRCPASPWGPFAMAQARVECRSGLRLRAFLIGAVVDNATAAAALRGGWGYATRSGRVTVQRHYDAVRVHVEVDGAAILDIAMSDPDPLSADDLQYVANMNLARTPNGLRLLQVEPKYQIQRAERGRPRVVNFDGAAWGEPRLQPVYPISASLAVADVTLQRVRFTCRPDVLAFDGTEVVR
jgi:hypothetical protein